MTKGPLLARVSLAPEEAAKLGMHPPEPSILHDWSAPRVSADSPLDDASLPSETRCILALASELLSYGLPVHRVEESIVRLARAFGQRATVMGFPTSLSVSLHGLGGSSMHVVRAEPGVVHLARLDALHRLVGRVERGELDASATLDEIRAIVRNVHPRTRARELLCAGLVGAGGVPLLGGGLVDAACAAGLAVGVGMLALFASLHPSITRVTPVIAAAAVTLASAALAHAGVVPHPFVVTLASLLVLLPGLTLTLATVELATGHLVCGTARLVGAATTFMQLGFGTLLGVRLGALAALTPVPRLSLPVWFEGAGAFVLALGFSGLLSVRRQDALATGAVSAFAWGASRALVSWQGPEIAILLAATGVGVISNLYARSCDRPSSILLVPGMVMLVPGSLGMASISSALLHNSMHALATLVHLLTLTMALSTGVLVAAAIVPPRTEL